jgi:hypothetical protein
MATGMPGRRLGFRRRNNRIFMGGRYSPRLGQACGRAGSPGGGNGGRGTRVARRVPPAPMSLGRSRPPRSASRKRSTVGLWFRILSGPVPKASHGIGTLARICAAPRATSLVIRGRSARAPIIGRIITPRIIIPGLVATMVRRATRLLRPLLRSRIGQSLFCSGLGDQCLGRGRG